MIYSRVYAIHYKLHKYISDQLHINTSPRQLSLVSMSVHIFSFIKIHYIS